MGENAVVGSGGVRAETREIMLFVVALVAAAGSARYYVTAVLDGDRLLSRSAAVAFVVFGVAAVVFFVRIL